MDEFLIHSYANLKTPIESNLKDLQNFIWSWGGGQNQFKQAGVSGNIFSMTLDTKKYYLCFSKFEKENFLTELYIYLENINTNAKNNSQTNKNLPVLYDEDVILPESKIFNKICKNINLHILKIREVLEQCGEGFIPYSYINNCFERIKKLDLFSIRWQQWNSFIGLDKNAIDGTDLDITDYVDFTGLLQSVLTKDDTKLEYSKKCLNCGTYYQAKGAKAVFCSEACRSSYRRKMKKEKARPSTL